MQQIGLRRRVMKSRLKWFGHVRRMGEGRLPGVMEDRQAVGTRLRGRPIRRCKDSVVRDVERRSVRGCGKRGAMEGSYEIPA